jgi:hypothetical protein
MYRFAFSLVRIRTICERGSLRHLPLLDHTPLDYIGSSSVHGEGPWYDHTFCHHRHLVFSELLDLGSCPLRPYHSLDVMDNVECCLRRRLPSGGVFESSCPGRLDLARMIFRRHISTLLLS